MIHSNVYGITMSLNWIFKRWFFSWKHLAVQTPTLVYYIDRDLVSITRCYTLYFILYDPKITESLGKRLGPKVKAQDSQLLGLEFKTSGWFQVLPSLSSFYG